jgi:hypothetical protein
MLMVMMGGERKSNFLDIMPPSVITQVSEHMIFVPTKISSTQLVALFSSNASSIIKKETTLKQQKIFYTAISIPRIKMRVNGVDSE